MKQPLLLISFSIALLAKGQIIFQKDYTPLINEYAGINSVMQTSDSGYILTGYLSDSISESVLLIKTNAYGDTLWTRTYKNDNEGFSVQQTFDGGYIIIGWAGINAYLLKTNSNGDSLWTKTYSISNDGEGFFGQQTSDSGYMIAGSTANFITGGYDFILIKTDKNGDTLWSKSYGTYYAALGKNDGANTDVLHGMQQTKDGGYIMAGVQFLYPNSSQTALIIKTDSRGNPIWSHTYGYAPDLAAYHAAYSIQQTMDGGYIIDDNADGTPEFFKLDSNGAVLWIKYNNDGPIGTVIQTKDGGYALIGNGNLTKTDSNGDSLWIKGYAKYGGFSSIEQTNDGGFILAGVLADSLNPIFHFSLVKTDGNGNSTCNVPPYPNISGNDVLQIIDSGIIITVVHPFLITETTVVGNAALVITPCLPLAVNEILNENSITLYPNPATDQLTIHTSSFHNEAVTVSIMNVLGQNASPPAPLPARLDSRSGGQRRGESAVIDISGLPAGMYFLRMQTESVIEVKKFIKE